MGKHHKHLNTVPVAWFAVEDLAYEGKGLKTFHDGHFLLTLLDDRRLGLYCYYIGK